ncbi:hypothetical protein AO501_20220 [Mycobacterium gordonae]|uniref:Uncharacterized protein n=1 Tax=Mycobacterium gordonae TaxID=1778 RepID=A0A0Q2LYR9_MYCGO|nr:hypothetical protein AO501_20220 [Mycobacterium gordonae]
MLIGGVTIDGSVNPLALIGGTVTAGRVIAGSEKPDTVNWGSLKPKPSILKGSIVMGPKTAKASPWEPGIPFPI